MSSRTWVAFLRGINLGKRQMKMAELAACCEAMGLSNVKTLLASGNVRFDSPLTGTRLKTDLEAAMLERFGFPVKVVLRSGTEIEAMLASDPFAQVDPNADVALHVLMADGPVGKPDFSALPAHIEVPRIDARDVYFVAHRLPNGRYTEGLEKLDKLLPKGLLVTMRNWNTMLKALK